MTRYWLGKKRLDMTNENNPAWKGGQVGMTGLHNWVKRRLGRPEKCEHCGKPNIKQNGQWILDWANKSREYKREIDDWIGLCSKCHSAYDKKEGRVPWNKGKKQPYNKETLQAMSDAKLNNPVRFWLGKKRPNVAKKAWITRRKNMIKNENNH